MGFFSGLVNTMTGRWADVTMTMTPAVRGRKSAVTVNVNVRAEAITPTQVYVHLRCKEEIAIPDYKLPAEPNQQPKSIKVSTETFVLDKKIAIAPAQQLAANSQRTYTGEVEIPADMPPTCKGKNAHFKWFVTAAIEMPVNNPDAGWQEIVVT